MLFDSSEAMTRVDMNEYSERIAVSRLVGAPPGYVGYDQGGALTEAVRTRPYQVILLDEFEKADRAVSNLLLQVFDEGSLHDAQGRSIDFRNTIIILTANIGAGPYDDKKQNVEEMSKEELKPLLERYLSPELVNRLDDVLVFKTLSKEDMLKVLTIQLGRVTDLLKMKGIDIALSEDVKRLLCDEGYNPEYGSRPLKKLIQSSLLDHVATCLLEGKLEAGHSLYVTCVGEGLASPEAKTLVGQFGQLVFHR